MTFLRDKWKSLKNHRNPNDVHAATSTLKASRKELYHNEDFQLIHVHEEDDGSLSMNLAIPDDHYAVRKDVHSQGFYTVSHFWGDTSLCEPWTDHGILDPNGDPIKVMIRPEKCKPLLELLRAHPGYWWIDIFCAQSNTPTVIMGDIFMHCRRCFVLADCQPSSLWGAVKVIEAVGATVEDCQEHIDSYVERVSDAAGSKDMPWDDILDDLFGWWYKGDPSDIDALADVLGCQWFARVWTLQEFVLPRKLCILSETKFTDDPLERTHLDQLFSRMLDILHGAFDASMGPVFTDYQGPDASRHILQHWSLSEDQTIHAETTLGVSRCYYSIKKVQELQASSLRLNATDASRLLMHPMILRCFSKGFDLLPFYLASFTESPRTCTDPSDYIYGVIGLLDIDIPRTSNQRLVWVAFRNELRKRAPYLSSIPHHYDFADIADMQSFYRVIPKKELYAQLDTLFRNALNYDL